MAFPTNGVLYDFNAANQEPLPTPPFEAITIISSDVALRINTNACHINNGLGISSQPLTTSYGPNTEVYITVTTVPSDGDRLDLYARISNPNSANTTGYRLTITKVAGANNDTWKIDRIDTGPTFVNLTSGTQELSNGDKFGFELKGSALKGYYNTGGTWNQTPIVSTTDATYTGSGQIGPRIVASTDVAVLDDLGGGTITASAAGLFVSSNPLTGLGVGGPFFANPIG